MMYESTWMSMKVVVDLDFLVALTVHTRTGRISRLGCRGSIGIRMV